MWWKVNVYKSRNYSFTDNSALILSLAFSLDKFFNFFFLLGLVTLCFWVCSGLNVLPSNLCVEILIPNVIVGGSSWRWLGHEGGVLMNDISALKIETPEAPLPLLPSEDTARTKKVGPHQIQICWLLGFSKL